MKRFPTPMPSPFLGALGFTTMELMIVVVIVGILAATATPALTGLVRDQRIKAATSELHFSLLKARSEAIKRNRDVTLAPITAGTWKDGWTIADPNNAGSNIEKTAGFTGLTVTGASGATAPASVVYQSSGRISGSTAPNFDIGATGSTTKRCVSIDLSGRPYTKASTC